MILVATETVLLVLLALLVAGLLRSHAEILRRLGPPGEDGEAARRSLPDPPERRGAVPAPDLAGTSVEGDPVQVGLGRGGPSTLLAFLTTGCLTCRSFWESLGSTALEVPGGARVVAVTKGRDRESPSRLRELAPADLTVVMSSAAWEEYGVPGSPYFVYVDGASGEVRGEGTATGWAQVASLLRDALDDAELAGGRGGRDRVDRVDRELEAAGIGPGHPSLYPGDSVEEEPKG